MKNGFAGLLAVPMWTAFMKSATAGDSDTWFAPPRDVVPVEVCRLSGHLPGFGCRSAAAVSATGEITYKSMVYTDYFVRGREPVRTCDAHTAYSPYPEPSFAEAAAFDSLPALFGMERVVPDPLPASLPPAPPAAYSPPSYPPASLLPSPAMQRPAPTVPPPPVETSVAPPVQKREIDLPAAPPEARPDPPAPPPSERVAPALPPPEPIEAPPK